MAVEDYPYTFNPILLIGTLSGVPVAGAAVILRATPGGVPLDIADMQGNALGTSLTSSELGILPAHRTTVAQPYVDANAEVVLRELAQELANSLPQAQAAAADAAASRTAAEAAAAAAGSSVAHTHPASEITTGTFDVARIPALATSKVTTGTWDAARLTPGTVLHRTSPASTRPTTRTDITVLWSGYATQPAAAIPGDIWLQPAGT